MNKVLYRKYRPTKFSEVVGQKEVIEVLTKAVAYDKVAHAYLFAGPKGTGKTTVARILAKAVNCELRKPGEYEPCNQCSSCLEIMSGKSLDLIEMDAASNRGIDDIRALREQTNFAPSSAKYKFYIIDEAHQLSKDAAQALLKTLEEPLSNTVFVLATTEFNKILPTIASRCQVFHFKRLTRKEIILKLSKIVAAEGIEIEPSALELIASVSGGALRDAETNLEKVISLGDSNHKITLEEVKEILNVPDIDLVIDLANSLLAKDFKKAFEIIEEVKNSGKNFQDLLPLLLDYFKELLMLKIAFENAEELIELPLTTEQIESLKNQAQNFEESYIRKIIEILLELESKIKNTSFPDLAFQVAILKLKEA